MNGTMTTRFTKMKQAILAVVIASLVFAGMQITAKAGTALVWPVPASHNISQGFHDNNAIDISAPEGTQIVAAMSGKVTSIYKCNQTHHYYGDCNGFGTGLVILGDDGRAYQYAHMQAGSIPANVYYGARVQAGQAIGKVGQTGYAYGPHLHFGISYNSKYWEAGPDPSKENYAPANVDIKVGNQSAANITETNAKISATLYKAPGITCTSCGLYLGTSATNLTKRNTEAVGSASNNYRGGNSFDIWYDLTSELGIRLTKGTTYYYQIYAVVNGKEYRSPVTSFRTTGTAAVTPKPVTKKLAQPMKLLTGNKTYKYKTVKKYKQVFWIIAAFNQGKVTYKSNSKYIQVSGNKVTVKKGTPKGKYKVTVKAAGNSKYNAGTKTVTITVK